jgi:transcriptional regulator with XRE-family HTH domain
MNRIKLLRQRRNMSQAELAEQSGLSQPFISRLERGESEVTSENLRAIADALGVSVSELYPEEAGLQEPHRRLWRLVERVPPEHRALAADLLENFLKALRSKPPGDQK